MAHAALGDHVVREVAQGAGAPLQHRDLHAVLVAEGHVQRQDRELRLDVFSTSAATSQYACQYQVSPTAAPEFGATYHPLEPLSARFGLTATF